ncbi:S24 family peptidase [Jatrophihabitans telluris]|uniref:S24 family peptidase n=1 Tax=Jatrophihabitans telluris TaxID=2038343 RepID=A0ABY4R3Y7_9ACTN|nr:S24 family peptidase [Jatrophihabitans telluris]UQX89821.1 S24 family peptidase [Jatrophihabitans telluris]
MRFVLPYQLITVSGQSMTPTLWNGDRVLVRHGRRPQPGHVVLAEFARRPGLLVIKRVVRSQDGGWWLSSDNAAAGSASDELGVARVHAVAVCFWPGSPRRGSAGRALHGGTRRRRGAARACRWPERIGDSPQGL